MAFADRSYGFPHLYIPPPCEKDLVAFLKNHPPPASEALDRYGRKTVQDIAYSILLIENGLALAFPQSFESEDAVIQLLATESSARLEPSTCIDLYEEPATEKTETGRFAIIRGKVRDVFESRQNIYLNFGEDWKTDFTIRIKKNNKNFDNIDLNNYKDQTVRARGFIESYNGPSLTLDHPFLIEKVSE